MYNSYPQFGECITTEGLTTLIGFPLPTTREIKQFSILTDTMTPIGDNEDYFTPKEITEIFQSMIDIKIGNYKKFDNIKELFADLDSE